MSGSNATNSMTVESVQMIGAAAHVVFRVRCEKFRHGEEVYLVPDSGSLLTKVRIQETVPYRRCES